MELRELFFELETDIYRRKLLDTEKEKIIGFVVKYNVEVAIVYEAFLEGYRKGRLEFYFIDGIIRNWAKKGISSIEDYQKWLSEYVKRNGL